MAEMRVSIEDPQGDVLSFDSSGRLPTVQPAAAVLYSETATSRTTSGSTSSQTWPSGVSACWVSVNMSTLSGGTTPAVTVALQQQDANSNWHTLSSSSSLSTSSGSSNFSVGHGMAQHGDMIAAGGSYRFTWTVTGAPTTCSFQIAMSGR
ncbi:hypothetical protein ACFUJU_07890 [Streptomyces sp. NPDC057235]|uniref:hypothetical protein n=1 Tax=Streptomyces sp. NPDC057235 TaxID=3346058 RepID=UPI003642A6C7